MLLKFDLLTANELGIEIIQVIEADQPNNSYGVRWFRKPISLTEPSQL